MKPLGVTLNSVSGGMISFGNPSANHYSTGYSDFTEA